MEDGNRCSPLPKPTLLIGELNNRRIARPTNKMEFLNRLFHWMDPSYVGRKL